jgi:hypothetical protein
MLYTHIPAPADLISSEMSDAPSITTANGIVNAVTALINGNVTPFVRIGAGLSSEDDVLVHVSLQNVNRGFALRFSDSTTPMFIAWNVPDFEGVPQTLTGTVDSTQGAEDLATWMLSGTSFESSTGLTID